MPDISGKVEAAARAAFDDIDADNDEQGTAPVDEAPVEEDASPPENAEGEDGPEDGSPDDDEDDEVEAGDGTAEDILETYMGVPLADIPVERRADIIRELQERDKVISRLQQQKAEAEKAAAEASVADDVEPEEAQPLTDEEVLRQFGLDPEDPMYEVKAEVLLPVARQVLPLAQTVEAMMAERQADEALGAWYGAFDALEAEFGNLPSNISREDVIEFALERNILDPEAAFHAVTAGARKAVVDETAKARQEALKALKEEHGRGRKSRAGTTTPKENPIKAANLIDAVAQAAKRAEERTGFKWGSDEDE